MRAWEKGEGGMERGTDFLLKSPYQKKIVLCVHTWRGFHRTLPIKFTSSNLKDE